MQNVGELRKACPCAGCGQSRHAPATAGLACSGLPRSRAHMQAVVQAGDSHARAVLCPALQDINEFLTNELKARSVATTQLEERVVALTARLQEVQREAQAEVTRARAEAAAEAAAAGARAAELSAQLEGSSEFLQQREALDGQLAQLRAALAAKSKEVEQKLSDLERRHLQEKERARQEVAVKIRETKIAMAQLAGAAQPAVQGGCCGVALAVEPRVWVCVEA
ncbi:hypothetical protein COO60DRAFT_184305 [Scenedesmus sp. NREL 46B-D3]|nr:hypothetical protein COO60DRAFT_184305 [Scenedesmus sp. NREL 46B-D3]